MNRLVNKVAVITGAGGGIGRATAIRFAKEGIGGIVCVDKDSNGLKETIDLLNNNNSIGLTVDVSREADCKRMIDTAVEEYGGLDILFNNAGIMHSDDGTEQETSDEVWDLTMNINVKGVWYGCKYGIPEMIKNGGGSI